MRFGFRPLGCEFEESVSECEEESTLTGGTSRDRSREHTSPPYQKKSQSGGWGIARGGGRWGGGTCTTMPGALSGGVLAVCAHRQPTGMPKGSLGVCFLCQASSVHSALWTSSLQQIGVLEGGATHSTQRVPVRMHNCISPGAGGWPTFGIASTLRTARPISSATNQAVCLAIFTFFLGGDGNPGDCPASSPCPSQQKSTNQRHCLLHHSGIAGHPNILKDSENIEKSIAVREQGKSVHSAWECWCTDPLCGLGHGRLCRRAEGPADLAPSAGPGAAGGPEGGRRTGPRERPTGHGGRTPGGTRTTP